MGSGVVVYGEWCGGLWGVVRWWSMGSGAVVYGEWCGGPSSIKHLKLVAAV